MSLDSSSVSDIEKQQQEDSLKTKNEQELLDKVQKEKMIRRSSAQQEELALMDVNVNDMPLDEMEAAFSGKAFTPREIAIEESDPSGDGMFRSGSPAENSYHKGQRVNGVKLAWRDIELTSDLTGQVLMKGVSGSVQSKLLAIMGASGAGKSTLMNFLACRLKQAHVSKGSATIDDQPLNRSVIKKVSGYVMQDDLLFPTLTIYETLLYCARLRLPFYLTQEERIKRVHEVIAMVGLTHRTNNTIGGGEVRGISGGEKRRVCIAIELIPSPRMLFLDEPTSGLDTSTALHVVSILKDLASDGVTVLCTIHQPQASIFNMFDDLLLLEGGETVYHGPAQDVVKFYAKAGHIMKPGENPADFIVNVISCFDASQKEEVKRITLALKKQYNDTRNLETGVLEEGALKGDSAELNVKQTQLESWARQVRILCTRACKIQFSSVKGLVLQLFQTLIMAILIGVTFGKIDTNQSGIPKRQSLIFFCVVNQGLFSALQAVISFPQERLIVIRERAAGSYGVSAYFVAKMIPETLLQMIFPSLFTLIVYFWCDLRPGASHYFVFNFMMIFCSLVALALAIMISAIGRSVGVALTVMPIALEITRLFGGFFMTPKNTPKGLIWLSKLSYLYYGYVGVSIDQLTDLEITCTSNEYLQGPNGAYCPITSGNQVIQIYGFDLYIDLGLAFFSLFMLWFCFRVISYLALRYLK